MKRDMDLVRKILFEVEKEPYTGVGNEINIPEYSGDDIEYHLMLLEEAGFIEVAPRGMSESLKPTRLTWEGHEFLDAARDNTRWEKAKGAMSQAGGFALDVMKQLLVQYLKAELKLS